MSPTDTQEPADALDMLEVQDKILTDLLGTWRGATETLRQGDDVDTRWKRGSAVKLMIQHLAVRESAKVALVAKLREDGHDDLAGRLEGDGVNRRKAMDHFEELTRGRQGMALNTPEMDEAVETVGAILDAEIPLERSELLPAMADALGPAGERDLPGPRHIRTHAPTHPSPVERWYDRGPLKAARAFYDHLRGTPTGATSPAVEEGREHTPGMKP